jgi:Lon protease-like protein
MPGPFEPSFADLPRVIPIFPLTGVLLLPGGMLPLNIFEPRYLNMTQAALASDHRTIGMIQPLGDVTPGTAPSDNPPVYQTGCAGRIVSFAETEDGRFLITLAGMCRFNIVEEMPLVDGYRRAVAEYGRFRDDMVAEPAGDIDRARLLAVLKAYLAHQGIEANWKAIEDADDSRLVASLAMMCPFQASEKQALLEAPSLTERAQVIVALLEMAVVAPDDGGVPSKQ